MSKVQKFETLTPSQFTTFKIQNTFKHRCHLRTPKIRIAILDSPQALADDVLPKVAVMIVPEKRETELKFCTESEQLEHLLKFNSEGICRLILIGNDPEHNPDPGFYIRSAATDPANMKKLQEELLQLVTKLSLIPKVCFQNDIGFVTYTEGDLLYREIKAELSGDVVGEFVVEDVVMESGSKNKLRRRLRFKRTPNMIQSQVDLVANLDGFESNTETEIHREIVWKMKDVPYEVDTSVLVQPYLIPMVSGLSLISSHLNERFLKKITVRALCLGVGGGALLSFLNTQLGFEVVGVEADEAVLRAAKQYFGLNEDKSLQLFVGDPIEVIRNFATEGNDDGKIHDLDGKFDAIMVDLDSSEAKNGVSSPPLELFEKSVIDGVRLLLHDHGVFIVNVVPEDDGGDEFDLNLIKEVLVAFHKVYAVDVKDTNNFVLMATLPPPPLSNDFLEKLRSVIPGDYMKMESLTDLKAITESES